MARHKKARKPFGFKAGVEVKGIKVIVFHRVGGPDNPRFLKAADAVDEIPLHVLGQGTGSAVHIHLVGAYPLGLDKNMVPLPPGKPDYLILNRGAVAGARANNFPAVERGTVHIGPDDLVGFRTGVGDPAGQRRPVNGGLRVKRKGPHLLAVLFFHFRVINGVTRYPRRGSGFKPPEWKSPPAEILPQPQGRFLAKPPLGRVIFADEDFPLHESSGGKDHRAGGNAAPPAGDYPGDSVRRNFRIDDQVNHRVHKNGEVFLRFQRRTGGGLIRLFVGLRPGSLHRRPTGAVQHPVLDHHGVNELSHFPAQCVHFPDEVALGKPPHRRVAGKRADPAGVLGDQQRRKPQPGRCQSRLDSGVAPADYNTIIVHSFPLCFPVV